MSDSSGVPWQGRQFEPTSASEDDGSAPPAVVAAIADFRNGSSTHADVVRALRGARLLIPLVAVAGDRQENDQGLVADATQELSIVTLAGPDGRRVMPAFTSVSAMSLWNSDARPVPTTAERVALAAIGEGTPLVIIDPLSITQCAFRRPALECLARGVAWMPSHLDPAVIDDIRASAESETAITGISVTPGDPDAMLTGPELLVTLSVTPGLVQRQVDDLLSRLTERWGFSAIVAERVDSLEVRLVSAD